MRMSAGIVERDREPYRKRREREGATDRKVEREFFDFSGRTINTNGGTGSDRDASAYLFSSSTHANILAQLIPSKARFSATATTGVLVEGGSCERVFPDKRPRIRRVVRHSTLLPVPRLRMHQKWTTTHRHHES